MCPVVNIGGLRGGGGRKRELWGGAGGTSASTVKAITLRPLPQLVLQRERK